MAMPKEYGLMIGLGIFQTNSKMLQKIKDYVLSNSVSLFKCNEFLFGRALFDKRGFYFSTDALEQYKIIRDYPHIYVAFTKTEEGFYYVGKSYQVGGRWKRGEAYHLGALARHILASTNGTDQNHSHWVKAWMDESTRVVESEPYSILLKDTVFISFIPFSMYSDIDHAALTKDEIRKINSDVERELISSYLNDGYTLLNVHNNRRKDRKGRTK